MRSLHLTDIQRAVILKCLRKSERVLARDRALTIQFQTVEGQYNVFEEDAEEALGTPVALLAKMPDVFSGGMRRVKLVGI